MQRKEKFQLSTFLDKKLKIIYKKSLSTKADDFLNSFILKYRKLTKENNKVLFNKILKKDNGKIFFKYIEGGDLDIAITNSKKDKKALLEILECYFNVVDSLNTSNLEENHREEGKKIFGNYFGKEMKGTYISSGIIDLIFSNIIYDGNNNAHIIDYEWVFDFPVSKRFILWRTLYYYIRNNRSDYYIINLLDIEFNKRLGVNIIDQYKFFRMECNFQEYVCGRQKQSLYKLLDYYLLIFKSKVNHLW